MNKTQNIGFLFHATHASVAEAMAEFGTVTVWDNYRSTVMRYMGKEEYRVTYVTKGTRKYITVSQVG